MIRPVRSLAFVAALSLLGACSGRPQPKKDPALAGVSKWGDASPHKSGFLYVNRVRLNYLDWGGEGPDLVLIHGLGDSPHVFDELAPFLRSHFRVLAYARRGHGHSDAPPGPYDLTTLVEDLRQFLDRLEIRRASLLGWSMGGNEITAFAGRYPERVERLVYLEAGYDWSDPTFLKESDALLEATTPDDAALRSFDAYRAWYRASWLGDRPWSRGLESYLRDTVRLAADGHVRPVPRQAVFDALVASLAAPPRDYTRVRAPALALYSTIFLPADPIDPVRDQQVRDWEERVMVPFRAASMDRIRRELRNVSVREIAATTHMSIGVDTPDALASIIRGFLLAAPARTAR